QSAASVANSCPVKKRPRAAAYARRMPVRGAASAASRAPRPFRNSRRPRSSAGGDGGASGSAGPGSARGSLSVGIAAYTHAVARDLAQVFERVDVSSEDDTRRLCRAVADRFGRIDVLINNAAIFFGIDNQDTSYAYLRKIFDVNYFGAWLMCRAVFPHMRDGGGGSIINQSSGAAYVH